MKSTFVFGFSLTALDSLLSNFCLAAFPLLMIGAAASFSIFTFFFSSLTSYLTFSSSENTLSSFLIYLASDFLGAVGVGEATSPFFTSSLSTFTVALAFLSSSLAALFFFSAYFSWLASFSLVFSSYLAVLAVALESFASVLALYSSVFSAAVAFFFIGNHMGIFFLNGGFFGFNFFVFSFDLFQFIFSFITGFNNFFDFR